jgi:hypothetical protein
MEILTFEQLPKAISELLERVANIEKLLDNDRSDTSDSDSVFSIAQASAFLNLPVSTIYGKVCKREILVSKKGKRLYSNKLL